MLKDKTFRRVASRESELLGGRGDIIPPGASEVMTYYKYYPMHDAFILDVFYNWNKTDFLKLYKE